MLGLNLLLTTLAAGAAAQTATGLKYMPFGDSITEIICWRAKLWDKLQTTEWSTVDFVGSGKTENNCRNTKYDRDNEGHSGFLAINIASQKQLVGWLQKNPADVISMHLGTNDIVQQSKNVNDIIAAFTTLVGQMRAHNPKIKIVVCVSFLMMVPPKLIIDVIGGSNHSSWLRHGGLQHQDPGAQRRDPRLGPGPEQDRVSHLGCRPVYRLQRHGR